MLGAIIKEWKSEIPGSDAEKPESPVLRMTRNMLADVVRRLEKLSLGHAPGDSGPQKTLGKRQSLRFKHEILELRGRVRDARNNLILAVTLASKWVMVSCTSELADILQASDPAAVSDPL